MAVGVGMGVGVAVGLGVGVGVTAATVPKETVPVARMRTAGRGYCGTGDVSKRSQLFRYGSQRFGTTNQLIPPLVLAMGAAAKEFRYGMRVEPTASITMPPPLSNAIRTG